MKSIVLFGHGSRSTEYVESFERIRTAVRARNPDIAVELGFLELSSPSLSDTIDRLEKRGSARITLVPVFIGSGRHVREDLPQLLAATKDRHPHLAIRLAPPIGEAEEVIGAMADYAVRMSE